MGAGYKLISSYTVGSGGILQIDFTSIPQTYKDLVVFVSARNVSNNYGGFYFRVNSSSTGYTGIRLIGTGSYVASNTSTEAGWEQSDFTANVFSNSRIYFANYTSATYKSIAINSSVENNSTEGPQVTSGVRWANTSAITSISLSTFDSGSADKFAQYSTAYLYGIN